MSSEEQSGDGDSDGGAGSAEPAAIPLTVVATAPSAATEQVGETIDRRVSPDGVEIALVKRGDLWEIVCDGQFLMASDCRRSEQSLAELSLAPMVQRTDISVLVAGLGMGHTLRAVLDTPGVVRVDVVEVEQAVIDWNRDHFGALHGNALADPRVRLHHADLLGFLKRHRYGQLEEQEGLPSVKDGWLAILLDVDNGPRWLSRPGNEPLYTEDGLGRLEASLRSGGVLGVWSSERDVEFLRRLAARFVNVAELAVPVEIRGHSSLDYIYRGRRPPQRGGGAGGGGRMAQA